jgi:hypothetical protein
MSKATALFTTGATDSPVTPATPRRNFLTNLALATAATGLAAVPALAGDDDAGLVQLCGEMIAAHRVWFDICFEQDLAPSKVMRRERRLEEANEVVYDLVDQIADIRPVTLAGARAKAHAAMILWSSGNGPDEIEDDNNISILARALITDLAGVAA